MKVTQLTCVAGKTIYRSIKASSGNHKGPRQKKFNPSKETVMKNNDRLAVRNLHLLLNANFKHGDLHVTLTYKNAPGAEEAKKDRKDFLRKLRAAMKKESKELKYVAVTEYENKRIHHHIVINHFDIVKIAEIWGKGFVEPTVLDDSGDYKDLAEYLIKETQKTFRKEGSMYKRRYAASQSLTRPVIKSEEVDASKLFEDPRPISGYSVIEETVRRFEHPVTGLEHIEYFMVAVDEPRRYKKWPRGKTVSGNERFEYFEEEQQDMFEAVPF